MWVFVARASPADAPYWPGRRLLAAIDAVAWPGSACWALKSLTDKGGLVVALVSTLLILSAARRLMTAVSANHRYRFTASRLARVVVVLALVGILLKLQFLHW